MHASGPPVVVVWATALRVAALIGVVSSLLGVIVYPGLRGNASEHVVATWEDLTHTFAYTFWGLLLVLLGRSTLELARASHGGGFTRVTAMLGGGVVAAVVFRALAARLEPPLAMLVAVVTCITATVSATSALRQAHTRAVGGLLLVLATSALLRLVAWEVAAVAAERASPDLYEVGRAIATAAVVLEGIGQLLGATWLGTRSRLFGQLLASLAISAAFLITWGAARGAHESAPLWQRVLQSGLVDAVGSPPPFHLGALATFLVPAGALLALVAAVQPRQMPAIVCAASLALLAHGSYDVPLRALAATCAAHWLLLATGDPRTMWAQLQRSSEARARGESAA
jgi:hypothetical protein